MPSVKHALFALAASAALSAPASAEPFSKLVAFSGALSDTGNMASVTGDLPAPFHANRNADGPVAVEVLAARLGGLEAAPSMHLKAGAGGTNFAVSDALAGGDGPHDLAAQVDAYLDRAGGEADPDALYFVFIGGNDVIAAAQAEDHTAIGPILGKAVGGIERAIHRLVAAGAKTLFVPDFLDLSVSPAVQGMGAAGPASQLSAAYNEMFYAMLDRLDLPEGVEIIRWSFGDFVDDVIAHYRELGFTDRNTPCVAVMEAGACDPERFVFLTPVYPTAKVHELVGTAMALAVVQRD